MRAQIHRLWILFFLGCDFTPPVNRKILETQELIENRQYERAVESYLHILEKNPPDGVQANIYYQIGDLYSIYLNKIEKGITYYKKSLPFAQGQHWKKKALERIADLLFSHLKNFSESIFYYERLLHTEREKRSFYETRLAQSYFYLFDFKVAQEKFQDIRNSARPGERSLAAYYLGMINFYQERWDKSIQWIKKYLREEKNRQETIKATFVLANALESKGDLREAYKNYHSLLGKYPNTEVIKIKLKTISQRRIAKKRN